MGESMLRTKALIGLATGGALLLAVAGVAEANFVFTKPIKNITFTTVGEKEEVIVKNNGAVGAAPKFVEAQVHNLSGGLQYIGVGGGKTLKECENVIAPGLTCNFFVEYKKNRGTEPSPEFWVGIIQAGPPCNITWTERFNA